MWNKKESANIKSILMYEKQVNWNGIGYLKSNQAYAWTSSCSVSLVCTTIEC